MQTSKIQINLINNGVLEFTMNAEDFEKQYEECHQNNNLIKFEVDNPNKTVLINPNHILFVELTEI